MLNLLIAVWHWVVRHLPGRLATGSFILNSGLTILFADDPTAAQLHGAAIGGYPVFKKVNYRLFTTLLATGEIVIGTALLLPVVPTALAAGLLIDELLTG